MLSLPSDPASSATVATVVTGAAQSRVASTALRPWSPSTPPGTWPAARLPVTFALASPASRDLGANAVDELDVATRTWGAARCTSFRAALATPATTAAPPGDDGVNAVYIHDDAWPSDLPTGVVAHTVVHLDADGALRDADVHLNAADYRFSLDGTPGTVDARSVLVHELGHALGLGHATDARATMFATYAPGIAWRSLERDDRDGVCALYPGTGAPGCGVGAPQAACPLGFACVAGACERAFERGVTCAPCARVVGVCDGAGDGARCIDIGADDTAGRVCARPCATASDCAAGFTCAPTTASGDLQCVPNDGCASGPFPCANDSACGGEACRGGACVGRIEPLDAGAPPAVDGGHDAAIAADDDGAVATSCAAAGPLGLRRSPRRAAFVAILALALAAARRRPR